jgi:hypothetical protein
MVFAIYNDCFILIFITIYYLFVLFVQAANSVIGSLLYCTGCFSVFRLKALSQVIPVFSRETENGADYIRKDLGMFPI